MEQTKILGYRFSLCARAYKKAVSLKLKKYDLTTAQCGVVRILRRKKELTQVEIAEIYASDKATTGAIIEKLTAKGYLDRKQDLTDRRAYAVSLTSQALAIAEEIEQISEEVEQKALHGLSEEEIGQFYYVLEVITGNLSRETK